MADKLNLLPYFAVRGLVNFLKVKGLPISTSLEVLGCKASDLNDPSQAFRKQDYYKLYQVANEHLDIPNLGFLHGKDLFLGEWGILGHIVMASENLSQAMANQHRYQSLISAFGTAHYEQNNNLTTLRWLSEPNTPEQIIEQVIAGWVSFAFSQTLSEQKPQAVHFVHSPCGQLQEYEMFFGCDVHFNSQFNGVVVDTQALALPLVNHNKEVLTVLCNQAELQLTEKKAAASFYVIQQFITEQLPTKVPSLPELSKHLGISVRQLQRKFQKEQTNLTELVELIRKNLAIAYLTQTDHKIAYIASVLGYSEQSAFQRAFKRWTKVTPQAFRSSPVQS